MAKKEQDPAAKIVPHYLYRAEELAPLVGLSRRQIIRLMDEGQVPFTLLGSHRGRRISGQQWLDWIASRAVEPVA